MGIQGRASQPSPRMRIIWETCKIDQYPGPACGYSDAIVLEDPGIVLHESFSSGCSMQLRLDRLF